MKSKYFSLVVVVTLVIVTTPLSAWATIVIDANTTIDSELRGGFIIKDGDTPHTTVEIVEGANIVDGGMVHGTSIVNFRDGTIRSYSDDFFSQHSNYLSKATLMFSEEV